MSLAYEIIVYGNTSIGMEMKPSFYPIKFQLIYRENKYEAWVCVNSLYGQCGIFDKKKDGIIYIHKSMKSAMVGKFFYKYCNTCNKKIYYPAHVCLNCKIFLFNEPLRMDESQNENFSKHLWYNK